jgi:hypothetical protein
MNGNDWAYATIATAGLPLDAVGRARTIVEQLGGI